MNSLNAHYHALLRSDFRLFMAKCFAHTNPATRYMPNWHIDLIVDDPLNPLQAASRTARDVSNQWFDHTFSTRLDDKKRGVIVVVMQRLHAQRLKRRWPAPK